MIRNQKPARGEAADICQTVINGVDCVMLFHETAEGLFPINAVNALAKICVEGERTLDHRRLYGDMKMYTPMPMITAETVAASSVNTVLDLPVDLIIVLTETGRFARLVAKYRPPVPILALSPNKQVVKQLQTVRGVIGHKIGDFADDASLLKMVNKITKDAHLCKQGQKVVFIKGDKEETADENNVVKIIEIE